MTRNGFTLIEMLVGLSIFALLASAGVGLLRVSADTQQAVDESLGEQAGIERIALLLDSDLSQVVDRPSATPSGGDRAAFSGSETTMQFVRGGVIALDTRARSDLRRVGWGVEAGTLKRLTFEQVDGGDDRLPDAALMDGVSGFALAYRNAAGDWVSSWPDATGDPMPRAVRVTLQAERVPETVMIVALPSVAPFEGRDAVGAGTLRRDGGDDG